MDFKLLSKTKDTIFYIRKIIINFPNKEFILKNNIDNCLYKLLECVLYYNVNYKNRVKEKYLIDYLVLISLIDNYLTISYDSKYLSKKQHENVCFILIELRKIANGVLRYVKSRV